MATTLVQNKTWTLALKGLTKSYSGNILFENLDLEFKAGKTVHVQGPNGAGKTQLMLVIAGLVEPDAGTIVFLGTAEFSINGLSPEVRAQFARYVPYLPGGIAELPLDRALLVLTRRLRPLGLHRQHFAALRVAAELESELQRICSGKIDFERPLAKYSVGEQKRMMALSSMSLYPYPELVMLDEPLAGLDRQGIARTLDLMQAARDRGIALLVSEHRTEISSLGFDQVLRLPYRANHPANAESLRVVVSPPSAATAPAREPVLKISDALGGYANSLVYCASLMIAPGELVLIQGPNGSGKTGFVRGLLGQPGTVWSGCVQFNKCSVQNLRSAQQRNAVRYLSQGRNLFPDLSVRESIAIADHGHVSDMAEEIDEIVRFLGPDKIVRHLSSGGRALLGLAQTVAASPSLMILDEPTANTDVENRERIWNVIGHICQRSSTAMLVIEHATAPAGVSAVYQIHQGTAAGDPARLERV